MAGIGGLDGVDGEETDGVGEVAAAGRRHGRQVTGGGTRRFAGGTLSHAPAAKQNRRSGLRPRRPRSTGAHSCPDHVDKGQSPSNGRETTRERWVTSGRCWGAEGE